MNLSCSLARSHAHSITEAHICVLYLGRTNLNVNLPEISLLFLNLTQICASAPPLCCTKKLFFFP